MEDSQLPTASAKPKFSLTHLLLGAVLLALLVLIGMQFRSDPSPSARALGVTAERAVPEPIDDPERIAATLIPGKTYEIVLNGGFTSQAQDKDWGINNITNLAFVFESRITREVESNDGKRIVEVRTFEQVSAVKTLCESDVRLELGIPGTVLLGGLDYLQPGTGTTLITAIPVVETILTTVARPLAEDRATKVLAAVDGLTGKKVRITYVDGQGVVALEPLGCELTDAEKSFLSETAILADCYLLPELDLEPDDTWTVAGSQLAGFFDPSLRIRPRGEVTVVRRADHRQAGQTYATLQIDDQRSFLELDSSDETTARVGTFEPTGTLHFSLKEGYVTTAELTGRMVLEEVSKDHLLFEARFAARPTIKINYRCQMQ